MFLRGRLHKYRFSNWITDLWPILSSFSKKMDGIAAFYVDTCILLHNGGLLIPCLNEHPFQRGKRICSGLNTWVIVISVITEPFPQVSSTAGEYFVQRASISACPPHNLCHGHKRKNEIYNRMASRFLHQKHASPLKQCFTKIRPKVKLYSTVFVLKTWDFP